MLPQGWRAASLLLPELQRATAAAGALARDFSGLAGAG
jgi:hypothetical protein